MRAFAITKQGRSKWAIGGYRWKGICSRAIHRVEGTDPQRTHNYFPSICLDRLGWWMEMGERSAVSPTQYVICCGQCNACKRGCSWAEHARNERQPNSPTAQRASRAGRGTQAQSLAEMVDGHKKQEKASSPQEDGNRARALSGRLGRKQKDLAPMAGEIGSSRGDVEQDYCREHEAVGWGGVHGCIWGYWLCWGGVETEGGLANSRGLVRFVCGEATPVASVGKSSR